MKTIAAFVILTGIILLFATADVLVPFAGFAYYFIGAGLLLLIVAQLRGSKEKNWLCRIGFHRFERQERDAEIPAMRWYRCKRCGKEKKGASIA